MSLIFATSIGSLNQKVDKKEKIDPFHGMPNGDEEELNINNNPKGILLDKFTAENSESDFKYSYGRFTIYVNIDGDDIDINAVTKGPFNTRIGLPEVEEGMKEQMVKDINKRLKKGNMSLMKRKVFRNLRNEIRKTILKKD